jgi:flagellum-specific peptidoglycan hydrolase FlgJ
MNTLKPTIQTTIAKETFINGVDKVYLTEFGYNPPEHLSLLIASMAILETGHFKSCYNFNTGNIKYTKDCGTDYMFLKNVFEYEKGVKVFYDPPSLQCAFRSYDSILDGITDHVLLLSKRPAVWQALHDNGDDSNNGTYNFCLALSRCKYFSSPLDLYYSSVNSIFNSLHGIK